MEKVCSISCSNLTVYCRVRYNKPPREAKMINNFSEAENICRKQAILELECQFYRNKTELIFEGTQEEINKKLHYVDRELGMMALDPRTVLQEELLD